jgi:superoxide reductase
MIEKKAVYRCEHCGNIVESLWNGQPDLTCCGHTMVKLNPNTTDAAKEKHVPVIIRKGNKVTVKVGEVAHPMTPEHYILFVELLAGDKVYRHDFTESDTVAEATFLVDESVTDLAAREFCNKHGFWATK